MKLNNSFVFLLTIYFIFLLTSVANADVPTTGALDTIKNIFRDNASGWSGALQNYSTSLFWILATIDFAWTAILLNLSEGDFSSFVGTVAREIIKIGFFYALLTNGLAWAKDIMNSMVQAGGAANGAAGGAANISPSDIFDTGYQLCIRIFDTISLMSPVDSLGLIIGGLVIMACFALIAAMMLLVYVQGYIVINAGVILLGFGGSSFTNDISIKYFQGSLSTGAKLFVMILLVGLGQNILNSWIGTVNITMRQICLFMGSSLVLLALVKVVPDMVGDMINGFSWGTGESLVRTGSAAKSAATTVGSMAVAATAGGVMAVSQAAKLHKAQVDSGQSTSSWVGGVAKNLASAAKEDVGGRLSGANRAFGTMGGRMAASMKAKNLGSPSTVKDEPYFAAGPANNQTSTQSTQTQGKNDEQSNA